jgi:glycylpeptide N-tetradecanoyltransferase
MRGRRLAPVLMAAALARAQRAGLRLGVYAGGTILPRPVASCRYHSRALDARHLVAAGFMPPPRAGVREELHARAHRPPPPPAPGVWRALEAADVPAALALLRRAWRDADLAPDWDEAEAAARLLPRRGALSSFARGPPGAPQALVSFMTLPLQRGPDAVLAARLFAWAPGDLPPRGVLEDAMALAAGGGHHVFDALQAGARLTERRELAALGLRAGTGLLHHYLLGWRLRGGVRPERLELPLAF